MKKNILIVVMIFIFVSCSWNSGFSGNDNFIENLDSWVELNHENYTWKICDSSSCEWNYIWWAAMNFAWTDLENNIIKDKIKLNTSNKDSLELVRKFNNPTVEKNNLDSKSYYVKSWYGQKTVNKINSETKKKFPNKTFQDLDLKLWKKDIISYAYFSKKVVYKKPFEKDLVKFQWKKYKWFYANWEQKKNIKILKYESDDKFIIKLELKDNSDELILAKWYNMSNPWIVVELINKHNSKKLKSLWDSEYKDYFEIPNLNLDYSRIYTEIENKCLTNKDFDKYCISSMFENIKFIMNEKWAKVENEAVISVYETAIIFDDIPKIRNFYLNDTFWLIMKRTKSKNPYFILWVNNDKILIKE